MTNDPVREALIELRELCSHVSPMAKEIRCDTVRNTRFALKFMAACEKADAVLAATKERS